MQMVKGWFKAIGTVLSAWLPVIFLYTVIYWLSSQPKLPGPEDDLWRFFWFKTAHLLVYGLLTLLIHRGVKKQWSGLALSQVLMTTGVILIALAIHDEWHQSLVPGRTAAVTDVLIDVVGGLLALFSFGKFKSR